MSITALPTPPSRTSPATFSANADAFLGALPTFVSEANALGAEINTNAQIAAAGAAAAEAAIAATDSVKWVSGTTYAIGDVRWSPTDYATYRRITAGAGTTDPCADATNWTPVVIHKVLRSARTSNTALAKSDNGYLIDVTDGSFTQTLESCASLGNGWSIVYRNSGTGTIVIDPNVSETIDGAASLTVIAGETYWIQCNGSALFTVRLSAPIEIREARTSAVTLTTTDWNKFINITSGTFTQSFAACAALKKGWSVTIQNSGTGNITLDPNASETIDGLSSFIMYPGEIRRISCDGTALTSVVLKSFIRTWTTTDSGAVVPPGYTGVGYKLASGSGGGGSGGRYLSTTSSNCGGAGGGGAGLLVGEAFGLTSGGTFAVTIGAGGVGGISVTSDNTNGNNGTDGGNTSLDGSGFSVSVVGGTGGRGGGPAPTGAYGGGTGTATIPAFGTVRAAPSVARGGAAEYGGGASGSYTGSNGIISESGSSVFGGGAGGGGRGYNTGTPTSTASTGTSTYGNNGGNGGDNATAGSNGGSTAGKPGGGGGGGGASFNGTASGKGGDGVSGFAILWGII